MSDELPEKWYGKLDENGVVIQKQPYAQDGFVEIPSDVVCGMVWNGDEYETPDPSPVSPPEYPTEIILSTPSGALVRVTADDNGDVYGEKLE